METIPIFIDMMAKPVYGTADGTLEFALTHFTNGKDKLVLTYLGSYESSFHSIADSDYIPRCKRNEFEVKKLVPQPCTFEEGMVKLIVEHRMRKFVANSRHQSAYSSLISKLVAKNPQLSCKVWFVSGEWSIVSLFGSDPDICLISQLEETKNLLAIEKEKSTKIENDFNKFKSEASEESQKHEKNKNRLVNISIQLEETETLLKIEKEKSTIITSEQTRKRNELEKTVKLHDEVICGAGMANLAEFSYTDLKDATDNFNIEFKIGQGGFGGVYKGVIHCTTVAIKILNTDGNQGVREFNQEIETLQKVRHPKLVTLIGACPEKRALVYELMPKGNLQECLRNTEDRKFLSWEKRIQIALDVSSALVFLHHFKPYGIVHGDLKPANILLDSNYTCKLSDFGICRQLDVSDTTITPRHKTDMVAGTPWYMDPDIQQSGVVTARNDVYAFGIVLLQLVTGKEPMYITKSVQDAIQNRKLNEVVDASAEWPLEVAEKMAQLGLRCVNLVVTDRPDPTEVWTEIKSVEPIASP